MGLCTAPHTGREGRAVRMLDDAWHDTHDCVHSVPRVCTKDSAHER